MIYSISKLEFIGALALLWNEQGRIFDNFDFEAKWDKFVQGGKTKLPEGVEEIWNNFGGTDD